MSDLRPRPFNGFRVDRSDLRRTMWEHGTAPSTESLAEDEVLIDVGKFGFTANNVTYARLGDQIAYWRFFPTEQGWGRIPVWGVGTVSASRNPAIREGEGVFGYLPMATHLVVHATGVRGQRFIDAAAHRAELPPVYNEYLLTDRDPEYDKARENEYLVLRPLFALSFFCAEFLKAEGVFGAKQVIISSASSKTAIGLAFLLGDTRRCGVEVVGLTSAGNAGFVSRQSAYDRVLAYEEIESLSNAPAVFVDIAGNAAVCAAVHRRLGDALKHSARVGFTHWDTPAAADPSLPGPRPVFFFTPDHMLRCRKEWGPGVLKARLSEAWQNMLRYSAPWLVIEHTSSEDGIERVYREAVDGRTPPEKAHVLSITALSLTER